MKFLEKIPQIIRKKILVNLYKKLNNNSMKLIQIKIKKIFKNNMSLNYQKIWNKVKFFKKIINCIEI